MLTIREMDLLVKINRKPRIIVFQKQFVYQLCIFRKLFNILRQLNRLSAIWYVFLSLVRTVTEKTTMKIKF